MSLQVTPLPAVGARVDGFDLDQPVDEALAQELRQLWLEHAILLFRGQPITPERQIEFSRAFGPLATHPLAVKRNMEYPELFQLEAGGPRDEYETAYYGGEPIVGRLDWHMDLHYTGRPNHGALLRAVKLPAEDGKTGFGDLAKAYDALDDATRQRIDGLEVAYVFNMQRKHMRFVDTRGYEPGPKSPKKPADVGFPDFNDSVYPIVVKHPETGRAVLEIVEQFLDRIIEPEKAGMTEAEAHALLAELVDHTRDPAFHYIHEWQEGDMVLWDNWRAMHCTTGTPPGVERLIHRTTIEGDVTLGRQLDYSSGITS